MRRGRRIRSIWLLVVSKIQTYHLLALEEVERDVLGKSGLSHGLCTPPRKAVAALVGLGQVVCLLS